MCVVEEVSTYFLSASGRMFISYRPPYSTKYIILHTFCKLACKKLHTILMLMLAFFRVKLFGHTIHEHEVCNKDQCA